MLSYQNWKVINEAVGGFGGILGFGSPQNLGMMNTHTEELPTVKSMTDEEVLADLQKRIDEVKKNMKKKMGLGDDADAMSSKKKGKNLDDDDDDDDEEKDDDKKEPEKNDDKDVEDDDKDVEDDDENDDDMDDEDDDELDDDEDGDAEELMMKKKMKKGDSKKKPAKAAKVSKKVTKEDADWLKSVRSMLDVEGVDKKFWDGNSAIPDNKEIKAGSVGYAPVSKVGSWF